MRVNARQAIGGLFIAGVAGGLLFLPAIVYLGTFLAPAQIAPVTTTHAAPLIADAIWAKTNGGRATELEPINPFTIGRMAVCQVWASRTTDIEVERAERDECMKLMPGVQAVGYLSSIHLRSEGVWQDPRVPFVQLATMTRVSDKWTKTQLIDALAERAEFPDGSIGVEQAARTYFGKGAGELTVAQAGLLAALLGERRLDPWCSPSTASIRRQQILERMRDNLAIDAAAFESANVAPLGIISPPANHQPCEQGD